MIWPATTLRKMSIGQGSQMCQQMAYLSTSICSDENEKQIFTWPIKRSGVRQSKPFVLEGLLVQCHFTLLYCILFTSKAVCVKPGNRCFKQRSKLSALLAICSCLFSSAMESFIMTQEDLDARFDSFVWIFRCHTWIAVSNRSAISNLLCSLERSNVDRSCVAEKFSIDSPLYRASPRLTFALCVQDTQ